MGSKRNAIILVAALSFLFIRNLPLCILMPLWSHGDEIGHFDYVLKLSRGHIPRSTDIIEPDLFELHRDHYDSRYLTPDRFDIFELEHLGLAQYSYEAHQPPLPYLIFSFFKFALSTLNISMLLQLKLLRIISLLAVGLGITLVYLALKKAVLQNSYYYMPLLFIPLLVKDMFFSMNTDSFSFLFGCLAVAGAILLFKNPLRSKYWIILTLGTVFSLWSKIPNAYLFALWPLLILFLWRKSRDKTVFRKFVLFFLIALILSSPWYLYNLSRYQNPFSNITEIPFPNVPKFKMSVDGFRLFFHPFCRTLVRGEFVWLGDHFKILSGLPLLLFVDILPILIFTLGFSSFFFPFKGQDNPRTLFLILAAMTALAAFLFAHFAVGGMPYYHIRYAYGALYLYMFLVAVGWKRIWPANDLIFILPVGGLILYQVVYTTIMVQKVLL